MVAFVLAALILIAAFVLLIPYVPLALQQGNNFFSQIASSGENSQTVTATTTHSAYVPLIQNGAANVTFPSDYSTLQAYALGLINQDRSTKNAAAVTLSSNLAAQQHADSMLTYGYFSHNDTQGYKPYMRYTLLGGKGADFENVAYIYISPATFTTTGAVENAIKTLESQMMYNDSACCNNGHMLNIIGALHIKVSIGIAYSGTTVYFDEEFENDYINLSFSVSGSDYVTMSGVPAANSPTPNSIYIAYDATPAPVTVAQLNNGPHEYGPGELIGGVLPPGPVLGCGQFSSGITVCADNWKFSGSQMDIRFSLSKFVSTYGPGVYTVYLITGQDTNSAITSISVFVT